VAAGKVDGKKKKRKGRRLGVERMQEDNTTTSLSSRMKGG
jgi:hypothetical protein